ncbi:hypothetical protein BCO37747_08166 [Burkholderia contaminans]|jgi:hypothetical protein|uniref:Uncharacterized protein n=2 Tax=Burkholderia cepacia complex TaxID=87882 RepID=A0A250LM41_9BURK|nr:hypothetical protein BCCH1_76500 [Burkholderia contaminans]CAB3974233.1 hypothetical protein BLA3211_07911 [Burkholderia aenigmatica]VWD65608.1 hypothetical protein BCO37747_08166 [Burkholderia contaminans]
MSIETPESQSAAEAADDKALVDLALKKDCPANWLAKACRVGCVAAGRRERLRAMLSQRLAESAPN